MVAVDTSNNHNKGGRFWEGGVVSGSYRNPPRGYSSGSTLG